MGRGSAWRRLPNLPEEAAPAGKRADLGVCAASLACPVSNRFVSIGGLVSFLFILYLYPLQNRASIEKEKE
jgi:hypothetical protein